MTIAVDKVLTYNTLSRNIFPLSMEGCVLYVPLWQEDMQGSPMLSYDQYHHSCTVTDATWGTQGRSFDGVNDLIDCGANDALNPTEAITLEAWFNASAIAQYDVLVIKANDVSWNPGYGILFHSADIIQFFVEWNIEYASKAFTFASEINKWHHVVGTYDRASVKIFVDAVEGTSAAREEAIDASTGTLEIGRGKDNTYNFTGIIGELRLYSRALSFPEIQYNYLVTKWRYQ